jgi:3-deoxy-manno-octulosonate cytidylyltransferase (CMP-KDO synthetase)
VYVNIQGDYPLLTTGHVARLVEPFLARPETQVTTLRILATLDEVPNPNFVKVVCDATGRALYFSRHPIPYDRDGRRPPHYKHVGLYAFRRQALDAFHRLPRSPLELAENLEQLRLLENGIPIVVAETDEATIAVETEEELRAVEAHLAARRT